MEENPHAGFHLACTERIQDSKSGSFVCSSLFLQGLNIASEKELRDHSH